MEDHDLKILSHVISSIESDAEIKDVICGPRFNMVLSKHKGLAYILGHCLSGKIEEKSGLRLAELAFSSKIEEASVGLSAVYSLVCVDSNRCEEYMRPGSFTD